MSAKILKIGDTEIKPGETKEVNLFFSRLYDHTHVDIPVKVIRGKIDGPTLLVSSTVHGDEINGIEVIKRLLNHKSLKKLKGTLIAVPIVNVIGFNNLSRYLPDRRDLNRCFPGSATGSLASRLAYLFVTELLAKATHVIDLHTAAVHRANLPHVRADLKGGYIKRMASEFDVPLILDSPIIAGSLREAASKKKIPMIVYEAGEALRYSEAAIKCGTSGVLSVMRSLEMIPERAKQASKVKSFIAKGSLWARAPHSGILVVKKRLGSVIKKGDLLGAISDPLGSSNTNIYSTEEGVIIGQTQIPLVNKGDALFHVATFSKSASVNKSMSSFDDKFEYEGR